MSTIRQVDENNQILEGASTEAVEVKSPKVGVHKPNEIGNIAITQELDMENEDINKYEDKIKTLFEWIQTQTDDLSPMNIKWVVRNLESRLGSPPLTEKRIIQLARYAYLDMESKRIESEKDNLYAR